MSSGESTPAPGAESTTTPAVRTMTRAPWVVMRSDYLLQRYPKEIPLSIDITQGEEHAQSQLLAQLNYLTGRNAESLEELDNEVEYKYYSSKTMMPNMRFTLKQFTVRVAVYIYPNGKIDREAFKKLSRPQKLDPVEQVRKMLEEEIVAFIPKTTKAPQSTLTSVAKKTVQRGKSGNPEVTGGQEVSNLIASTQPHEGKKPAVSRPLKKARPRRVFVTLSVHPTVVDNLMKIGEELSKKADELSTTNPLAAGTQDSGGNLHSGSSAVWNGDPSLQNALQSVSGAIQLAQDQDAANVPYVPQFPSTGGSGAPE